MSFISSVMESSSKSGSVLWGLRRALRCDSLFHTYTVVARKARKRNIRHNWLRLGPDLRTGTVAGWRVVKAGVSS